jgi:hypothetical protein
MNGRPIVPGVNAYHDASRITGRPPRHRRAKKKKYEFKKLLVAIGFVFFGIVLWRCVSTGLETLGVSVVGGISAIIAVYAAASYGEKNSANRYGVELISQDETTVG